MTLSSATSLQPRGGGVFGWAVPDRWQQGRGAWGGLVAAGVVEAVVRHEPDPARVVRTVSLHLPGPLPVGGATVAVTPLRVGSNLSTWSVDVVDASGQTCAHAVVLTGQARAPELAGAMALWGTAPPPVLPAWPDVDPVPSTGPGWPVFLQHVELRVHAGLPLAGRPARCAGYVRLVDAGEWDAAHVLGIVDAWYPTALTVADAPRPLATVSFAAHLLADPTTLPAGQPLAYEAVMSAAHEGFTTELRRLWAPDGRLVVENLQSVVLI